MMLCEPPSLGGASLDSLMHSMLKVGTNANRGCVSNKARKNENGHELAYSLTNPI